jgi:hypothetical protein
VPFSLRRRVTTVRDVAPEYTGAARISNPQRGFARAPSEREESLSLSLSLSLYLYLSSSFLPCSGIENSKSGIPNIRRAERVVRGRNIFFRASPRLAETLIERPAIGTNRMT